MVKMKKNFVRGLCQELATELSPMKRAQAATTLQDLLAEEIGKDLTPAGSASLRIAGEIFRFLEELPLQHRLTSSLELTGSHHS